MTKLLGTVEKGWGHEYIWASSDRYCCKFLNFDRSTATMSMHFHKEKDEQWYVQSGTFEVQWIDTSDGSMKFCRLEVGDTWHNPPLLPHRLICIRPGTVLEVSTPDSVEDNFRVAPGDSQKDESRIMQQMYVR